MHNSITRRSFVQAGAAFMMTSGIAPILGFADSTNPAPKKLKLLILGGTGFLGPHIVERAVARGHEMTLFNRGRTNADLFPDLEKLRGDRDGDLKALEGRSWDAVIDTSGYVPRIVRDSASLLAGASGFYVFISTQSVYRDTKEPGRDETDPVGTLDDPTVEKITGETYGPLKALCEEEVRKAYGDRGANIRPGLIVGPRDTSDRFSYWPLRIERGGEVLAPAPGNDGQTPIQFIDARDLANFTIHLIEQRTGGTFNAITAPGEYTMKSFLETCIDVTQSGATLTWVDAEFLEEHEVRPWQDLPVWVPAEGDYAGFGLSSNERATKHGLTTRPVRETIRDLIAWYHTLPEDRRERLWSEEARSNDPRIPGLAPAREKELLTLWHERNA